jgi:mannose-6-phosphate isomerase-like protein (cupin superfamily)
MDSAIYALGEKEGTAFWFFNTLTLIKATASQTGGAFGLIEQLAPIGVGSPYHVHRAEDESFYILEGEIEFLSEGHRFVKGPGSFVFLPRDIPHGFRVVGKSTSKFLILTNPGGFEGFVAEMGEPASSLILPEPSAPDMEKLIPLAAKYQIEILGPLPD